MSLSVFKPVFAFRTFALILALAALYASLAGCARDNQTPADFAVGEMEKLTETEGKVRAPDTPFMDTRFDTQISLEAFEGKVVLVNLWATWCAPCLEEIPSLDALQAAKAGEDFEVVAISVDNDALDARLFLDEVGASHLELYHDKSISTARDMQAAGFPTTILYDRKGRELARLSGDADWNAPEVHALIDWAIQK